MITKFKIFESLLGSSIITDCGDYIASQLPKEFFEEWVFNRFGGGWFQFYYIDLDNKTHKIIENYLRNLIDDNDEFLEKGVYMESPTNIGIEFCIAINDEQINKFAKIQNELNKYNI